MVREADRAVQFFDSSSIAEHRSCHFYSVFKLLKRERQTDRQRERERDRETEREREREREKKKKKKKKELGRADCLICTPHMPIVFSVVTI